jgi:dihydrofolate synthase/folylpolyglutamate synthase
VGADLRLSGRDYGYQAAGQTWNWWSREHRHDDLPRPNLVGDFQLQNAAGALMALEMLAARCPVERDAIDYGLRHVALPGRYQEYPGAVTWVLDVAHNPQSARVLAETLKAQPAPGRTHFLAGMLRDKDIGGVFRIVRDLADTWHLASLPPRRGASAAQLREELTALGVTAPVSLHESVEAACAAVREQARSGDRVLVFGSFLTVAGAARVLDSLK